MATVPSYVRVDSRLAWHARESLEFSVVGQNLGSSRHIEFTGGFEINGTAIRRSIFARAVWRF